MLFFFCSAKIVTTQSLQKYAHLPYRSQKIIAKTAWCIAIAPWLHGAYRKGLEAYIKEPKSVSKYHAPSLRIHGKKLWNLTNTMESL